MTYTYVPIFAVSMKTLKILAPSTTQPEKFRCDPRTLGYQPPPEKCGREASSPTHSSSHLPIKDVLSTSQSFQLG